jgi:hypothetical protein
MVGPHCSPRNKTHDSKKNQIDDDVVQEPEVVEVKDKDDEEEEEEKSDNDHYHYLNGWYPTPGEENDDMPSEPPYGYYPGK